MSSDVSASRTNYENIKLVPKDFDELNAQTSSIETILGDLKSDDGGLDKIKKAHKMIKDTVSQKDKDAKGVYENKLNEIRQNLQVGKLKKKQVLGVLKKFSEEKLKVTLGIY